VVGVWCGCGGVFGFWGGGWWCFVCWVFRLRGFLFVFGWGRVGVWGGGGWFVGGFWMLGGGCCVGWRVFFVLGGFGRVTGVGTFGVVCGCVMLGRGGGWFFVFCFSGVGGFFLVGGCGRVFGFGFCGGSSGGWWEGGFHPHRFFLVVVGCGVGGGGGFGLVVFVVVCARVECSSPLGSALALALPVLRLGRKGPQANQNGKRRQTNGIPHAKFSPRRSISPNPTRGHN